MLCKDCEKYYKSKDPEHGFCSLPENFFPTDADSPCKYFINKRTCSDCDRFGKDTACMTARADDNADTCCGFVDLHDENVKAALFNWFLQGIDIHEHLNTIVLEFEASEEYKFLKNKRDK